MCNASGAMHVTNCRFEGNSAPRGGAVATLDYGVLELRGCLFVGNSATEGGAIYFDCPSQFHVGHCTLVDNAAERGAGIFLLTAGYTEGSIANFLVAFNRKSDGIFWDGGGALEVSCTDLFGNEGGNWIGSVAVFAGLNGNFELDPLFCGAQNPDEPYTLEVGSPCGAAQNPECGLVGVFGEGCGVTAIAAGEELPRTVRLRTCFPNPVRLAQPSTTLRYELDTPTRVDLRVFDATGRLVRVLVRGEQMPAGNREAVWNGRDDAGRAVSAGVYFVCLQASGVRDTGRVTLVK